MLRVHRVACRTLSRQYVTGASNMKTTVQFLDAVRVRHSLTSDYQLGKLLGVSHARISNYRVGRNMMDEAMCLKIAAALSLDDPGEVLVAIAHEREKRPEVKRAWERVAKRLAASTAAVLVALGLAGSLHNPFRGATQPAADQTTHMRQRRRRYGAVASGSAWQALSAALPGLAGSLMLPGCAGLPAAPEWSKADVGRELAFGTLLAIDWAQTREIAAHPELYYEHNPILGEHPSSGRVDAYMLAAGALHFGIANWLPGDWRAAWQWGGIVIEAGAVGHNYMIGIRAPF